MLNLLQSQFFWLGLIIIILTQAPTFLKVTNNNNLHPTGMFDFSDVNLNNLVDTPVFVRYFLFFLTTTVVIYILLCLIPPPVMAGVDSILSKEYNDNNNYGEMFPLYIAAMYIGVTRSGIPWLERIAPEQKKFFHSKMNVPFKVSDLALTGSRQLFSKHQRTLADRDASIEIERDIKRLTSEEWISHNSDIIDSQYYRTNTATLQLQEWSDDPNSTVKSRRELRQTLRYVLSAIFTSALKKGGDRSLDEIRQRLGINAGKTINQQYANNSALVFVIFVQLMCATIIWIALPHINDLFPNGKEWAFWPETPFASLQEILKAMAPIWISIIIALCLYPLDSILTEDRPLNRLAASGWLLLLVFFFAVVFQYTREFWSFGVNKSTIGKGVTTSEFISNRAFPFAALALCSVVACLSVIFYPKKYITERINLTNVANTIIPLSIITILFSSLSTTLYLKLFDTSKLGPGTHCVVYVSVLSWIAMLIGFASAYIYYKHRNETLEMSE